MDDDFSQTHFVLDMNQLRDPSKQSSATLIEDEDLEFTREYYDRPVKHGVQVLDDRVFQIYTKSLLHSRQALKKHEGKMGEEQKGFDNTEINIHSFASLIQPTNVNKNQVEKILQTLNPEEL